MRYLLHLAKKFEQAVLTYVGRDGSQMAVCLQRFFVCLRLFASENGLYELANASCHVGPEWLYPSNYNLDKQRNLLNEIISQHFPKTIQSRRQYKVSKHVWITPHILTTMKYKNKLYSRYLKSKSPDLYHEYKKCRNSVTHVKAKAKQNISKTCLKMPAILRIHRNA